MSRERGEVSHYIAPAAFLLAATIAILLIRSALHGHPQQASATAVVTHVTRPHRAAVSARLRSATTTSAEYHTIETGDTYGALAARYDTTVERLQELNPGVDPDALTVGTKIRVR